MASPPDQPVSAGITAPAVPPENGCRIDRSDSAVDAIFNSDSAHIAAVRTAIESLCESARFDAKRTGEIGLAVNEAIANIIRHAYSSVADQPIHAHAKITDEGIEITLQDWGIGKQPAAPSNRKAPDPLTPGGWGLVCMHNSMDQVLFTPQPRGMLLTMRRKRTD